eukprot:XP_001705296.1 Hypothetical protein GL50803_20113 [Giardia lamblia ATCC 50803]
MVIVCPVRFLIRTKNVCSRVLRVVETATLVRTRVLDCCSLSSSFDNFCMRPTFVVERVGSVFTSSLIGWLYTAGSVNALNAAAISISTSSSAACATSLEKSAGYASTILVAIKLKI